LEITTLPRCLLMESQKYLGEQFPDTPVLVRDTSLHKVLLNTEGLKRIGVIPEAERTVPPPGGVDVRRVDGMMTEEMMEAGPGDAWLKLPVWPLPRIKKSTIYGINSCHKFGIALIQEASANTVYLHGLRELEEENKLKLDINTHIMCGNKFFPCESLESLKSLLDVAEDFKSKHVDTRFVKFWLDGPRVEPGPTHCTLNGEGEPDPKIPFFMARQFLLMSPSTIQGE
jgi:predicted amidohydrolase YtcJ